MDSLLCHAILFHWLSIRGFRDPDVRMGGQTNEGARKLPRGKKDVTVMSTPKATTATVCFRTVCGVSIATVRIDIQHEH